MTPPELINHARNKTTWNDAEIARHLNIKRQTLHAMKIDKAKLSDHLIIELAELANLDTAATLAAVTAYQEHDGRTRDVWLEIAKRCALLGPIDDNTCVSPENLSQMYIMSTQGSNQKSPRIAFFTFTINGLRVPLAFTSLPCLATHGS